MIDSKKWTGKIEKRLVGPLSAKEPHLYIRGRDRTDALTLLSWQMEKVIEALGRSRTVRADQVGALSRQ